MVFINRDDVIKMIMEDGIYCNTQEDKEHSVERIINLSSFDVQPVIHAKWIMRGGKFRCSNCDALSPLTKGWEDGCRTYTHSKTKFCSECGAKMDSIT